DVLVVDVFPRGLGGELVEPLRAWAEGSLAFGRRPTLVLIARTLPADYIARYRLLDEVAAHFDLVLAPGEDSPFVAGLPSRSRVVRSPAFLLRNATELPSREEAARRLSVAPETGAVLCVGSGGDAECAAVRDIARYLVSTDRAFGYRLRLALPDHDADSPSGPLPLAGDDGWEGLLAHVSPLIEVLPAAAAIIGGAGYNLVHEARALGVPGCWRAWPRKYDDQAARVGRDATFATADDVVRWLAERGDSLRPPVGPPSYVNGATVAADALAAVL
ncbi:MAG TPA: hypothetical protein VGE52_20205, partial [Pirellulales bacterium]